MHNNCISINVANSGRRAVPRRAASASRTSAVAARRRAPGRVSDRV